MLIGPIIENYVIVESQMTLPVILDRLMRVSGPVQEDILSLLETVVFTQNHVPLNELSKLATIITICNDATFRLCLRTLVKFINFDAKFAGWCEASLR